MLGTLCASFTITGYPRFNLVFDETSIMTQMLRQNVAKLIGSPLMESRNRLRNTNSLTNFFDKKMCLTPIKGINWRFLILGFSFESCVIGA